MTGAELKAKRERMGLSQTELGEQLGGITQTSIWRWEHDKFPIPRYIELALKQIEAEQKKTPKS